LMPVLDRMQPRDYMHNYVAGIAGTSIWELSEYEFASSTRQLALDLIAAGVGGGPNHSPELSVARMAGLLGDLTEAETYFAQARRITAALGQRPLVAIANYDEALVRVRLKVPDRVRTTSLLDAALAEFGSLGMAEWAQRAQVLAEAVPSTKADDAELVLLTPREREVAELVAAGFSNRRIADELVIAEATAERHVTRWSDTLVPGHQQRVLECGATPVRTIQESRAPGCLQSSVPGYCDRPPRRDRWSARQ